MWNQNMTKFTTKWATSAGFTDNDELSVELERRRFGGTDRTRSHREFNLFALTDIGDGNNECPS